MFRSHGWPEASLGPEPPGRRSRLLPHRLFPDVRARIRVPIPFSPLPPLLLLPGSWGEPNVCAHGRLSVPGVPSAAAPTCVLFFVRRGKGSRPPPSFFSLFFFYSGIKVAMQASPGGIFVVGLPRRGKGEAAQPRSFSGSYSRAFPPLSSLCDEKGEGCAGFDVVTVPTRREGVPDLSYLFGTVIADFSHFFFPFKTRTQSSPSFRARGFPSAGPTSPLSRARPGKPPTCFSSFSFFFPGSEET